MNNNEKFKNIIKKDFDKKKNYNNIINMIGEKNMNKLNKYIIYICSFAIVFIFSFMLLNNNSKELKTPDSMQKNDNIIINNGNLKQNLDIDGKAIDKDLTNEFKFVNNLSIPNNYILERSFEMYEKENINDTNYSKLWQYVLIYSTNEENPKHIEITFTKEEYILSCLLPDKNKFKSSTINDKEILLFSVDNTNEKQAFFENNNYKFFIEATDLTNNEFVNLIKSIIN